MPQTNNIAISASASLVYFILSFVTLFILFLQYEFVNFGDRPVLLWWRFFSALYGLALLVLGCILLGMELANMEATCENKWQQLSLN